MIVLFKDLNSVIDVDDEVHGIFTSDLTDDLQSVLSDIVIVFLPDADDFLQKCCWTNSL